MHLDELLHLKSYEKIEAVLRRHPITFLPIVGLYLALAALPLGLYFILRSTAGFIFASAFLFPIVILAAAVYYLSILLFFFSQFIDYYLDILVITNDRIIDVDQKGLFARTVSELDLYKVQDVTSETKGFFATMFNYGNVYIQSAAATERFTAEDIASPAKVRKMIVDLSEADKPYHLGT
ncbi:MAG: hypothetical protein HW383_276 [Candidatus Magasanikbacteria bacterium]|nr:hypothetical protein [Candidatus Magasanikbacteria bacterium]